MESEDTTLLQIYNVLLSLFERVLKSLNIWQSYRGKSLLPQAPYAPARGTVLLKDKELV